MSSFTIHEKSNTSFLTATCQKWDGTEKEYTFDLDSILGNESGRFRWGWNLFSHSAKNIHISKEGILTADLYNSYYHVPAKINLKERIENVDGDLIYNGPSVPCFIKKVCLDKKLL